MGDPAIFHIQTGSSEPIYRQLVEQLRRRIASGQMVAGETLPSVRELAAQLAVNPMTISKAFGLMEQEGLVQRRRGQSMVVAAQQAALPGEAERLALLRPTLALAVSEARQLALAPAQVMHLLQTLFEESPDA